MLVTKYTLYNEIYQKFVHFTSTGSTKMEAYTMISDRYKISDITVMRACRAMEEEIIK